MNRKAEGDSPAGRDLVGFPGLSPLQDLWVINKGGTAALSPFVTIKQMVMEGIFYARIPL